MSLETLNPVLSSVRWVHEQLCSEENVAVSFSLGLGCRIRPNAAISLRVSRLVEEILGDLDGPGRLQYWLDLLGEIGYSLAFQIKG